MNSRIVRILAGAIAAGCLSWPGAIAAEDDASPVVLYRLAAGDQVQVKVLGAADLSDTVRLDAMGEVHLPLLGQIKLAGRSVRDAEAEICRLAVEMRLLKAPVVTIKITDYAVRQVMVLGHVTSPGIVKFPPERESLDILEAILMAGGFGPSAKMKSVKVTRTAPDGTTVVLVVDVAAKYDAKKREAASVPVFPGDVILVDEGII